MYDGPGVANGDTEFAKSVKAVHDNHIGDYVCTSGSFSGTVCNEKVINVGMSIYMTDYGQIDEIVQAQQMDNLAAVGNGDSGGPVFDLAGLAAGQVAGCNSRFRRDAQGFMRLGPLLTLSATLILTAACSHAPTACPASYAPAGVLFKLDELVRPAGTGEIRACMDDHCVTRNDASPWTDRRLLTAGGDNATDSRTLTARLVLTDPTSHATLFDASTRITLQPVDVPGCGGQNAYHATVRATAAGTLVPD